MYKSSWNGVFGTYFKILLPCLDPEIWASENFRMLSLPSWTWPISSLQCFYFIYAIISSQFVENTMKYVLKFMERHFWSIFLISPTISGTRYMSLGKFFECRRCLYGWAKGLCSGFWSGGRCRRCTYSAWSGLLLADRLKLSNERPERTYTYPTFYTSSYFKPSELIYRSSHINSIVRLYRRTQSADTNL